MPSQKLSKTTGNLLVVDDNPINLRLLVQMLTEHGHQVRPVPNGTLAVQAAILEPPDLILLDILMPDISGFEVCQQLKADEATQNIPIIFISALDTVADKVQAFKMGGVDYVTKPFQPEEVLARIETHLTIRRLQDRLHQKVEELEAFAHTVAHDLKNPLSVSLTAAQLIERYNLPEDRKLAAISRIIKANKKADKIVEELLLLAKVGQEDIPKAPIHMGSVIQQALERVDHIIVESGTTVSINDEWHAAVGYAPWIEEVWYNYISNGIKYGGGPPQLTLGSQLIDHNMVKFWIKDNGDGISAEEQAQLFVDFTQLHQIRGKGHGLGLSIAKRIIEKLNGEVGVASEVGHGCLFYFTLPALHSS